MTSVFDHVIDDVRYDIDVRHIRLGHEGDLIWHRHVLIDNHVVTNGQRVFLLILLLLDLLFVIEGRR